MNQPTTPNTVDDFPALPEPLEIEWPELHPQSLGCGVEDRNITDRYDAAAYGWQDGVDKAASCVPDDIYDGDQMRAYVLADRAQRPTVAGSVDTPDERAMFEAETPGLNHQRVSDDDSDSSYRSRIVEDLWQGWEMRARLAPAAPSREAVAHLYRWIGSEELSSRTRGDLIARTTQEFNKGSLDCWELVGPLFTHPAPSEIEAVELPELPMPDGSIDLPDASGKFSIRHEVCMLSTLTSYATEAVLKERAARKESTK